MMNLNSNNNNDSGSLEHEEKRHLAQGCRSEWKIGVSETAENTLNPIRRIVDTMCISPNPDKELIRLTIGDPTVFGNLDAAEECIDAVAEAVQSRKHNGYLNSVGSMEARQAVAEYSSTMGVNVDAKDVIITSGCSQSLDYIMTLLANPGQNFLIPRPGFPLYMTLAHSRGVETKFYDLLADEEWKVDLDSLESQIDENTVGVIVNSPSNPCGGVFSKEHIQEIISVCERYKIPIISDEVYENVVYNDSTHYPFAALSDRVPVFSVSSIAKRFLVPGWRLGWLIVHDRGNVISESSRLGLVSLTQRILGPCSIVQAALPSILGNTPQHVFEKTTSLLQENAGVFYELLRDIRGLTPIRPSGAMYMMVRIDLESFPDIKSDVDFTETLLTEQSVFCLPSTCFSMPGFFRIVLSVPQDKVMEACERLSKFCAKHYVSTPGEPLR